MNNLDDELSSLLLKYLKEFNEVNYGDSYLTTELFIMASDILEFKESFKTWSSYYIKCLYYDISISSINI